jgi:hypothetical protein
MHPMSWNWELRAADLVVGYRLLPFALMTSLGLAAFVGLTTLDGLLGEFGAS